MSEKILIFDDVEVSKNKFQAFKQPIALDLIW